MPSFSLATIQFALTKITFGKFLVSSRLPYT